MDARAVPRNREIGPWGTVARVLVGTALLVGASVSGLRPATLLLGAVAIPAAVTSAMLIRGVRATPLRAHASHWHCANIGIGVLLFSVHLPAALVFYGASMLVAAWRGFGACELLAVPNLVLGRNDQMACPVFLPVDAAEARFTGRELYCS